MLLGFAGLVFAGYPLATGNMISVVRLELLKYGRAGCSDGCAAVAGRNGPWTRRLGGW
jgi:hypothetical protein